MNFQQPHSAHFEPNPTFFKSQTSPIEHQLTQGMNQTQFQTNILTSGPPTFYFKERKGKLNWEKLQSADLDQLRAGANIPALESFLGNLTYAALSPEDCEKFEDPVLLKMFRVSQYALEYLLNYQTYLYGQTQSLDLAYKQGEENLKPLEAKARANLAEIQKRKDDLKAKKKILGACEKALKNPIFKCRECNKYFKSKSFLDEHAQRRHGLTHAKPAETKVILKETATSPMLQKKNGDVSISTTSFSNENKENERQANRRSMVAAPVTVEKGVLTEGGFEEKNNLMTQNLEALDQVKEMLKEMKQDDGKKHGQIDEAVRGKLEEILSTNNEIGRRVNQIEQKVDMYNLNVSRQFINNLTHEEDVDREKSRSFGKEKATNYYTGSSFKEQQPRDDYVERKEDESFHALKGIENQDEEEEEESGKEEKEERHEEKEKEQVEDIKVQEMYDDQEDLQIVPKVSRLRQARQEKKEEKAKEEKAKAKERENREFIENLKVKENFKGFENLVDEEPKQEIKKESYNEEREVQEEQDVDQNQEEVQERNINIQVSYPREQYEEEGTDLEEVREEFRPQGRTEVEKSEPVEIEEIARKPEKENVNVLRNSADDKIEQVEEAEEKPEEVVLSRRKKDWRDDVIKISSQIDPTVQEKAYSSVKANEEVQEIQDIQEVREDDPAYEDEDERERTMRIIENSMGIRGDEDNQMEKERKAYLKARKTMSLKYSMKIMPIEEVDKAEEEVHLDMKNSFKNLFGAEYDALAGKDVMDLESILKTLKGLNEKQKRRFTKMKTDYSRIQRKSILEDEQTNEQEYESLKGEQAMLPKEINDYDEEKSINETSMRLQKAKASLAELENVIYESKLN